MDKLGEIMEDVKGAHDMLHIAMQRAGDMPHADYAATTMPPHTGMAAIPTHAVPKT